MKVCPPAVMVPVRVDAAGLALTLKVIVAPPLPDEGAVSVIHGVAVDTV